MVVKVIHGMRIHSPPYTKAEEDEFYRRIGGGPITVASPKQQQPSPAKPHRS